MPTGRRCFATPSLLDADIRKYLEAENGYTESLLGHTAALQRTLVAEMRGRIKEDDSSVPSPDGPFAYMRKFREGGQHEMFGRMPRDGGEIEIVLDGDQLAADQDYFRFGGSRHSPDHRLVAWSADIKGSEYFSVRVRDWTTRADRDDLVEETEGTVVWSEDSKAFFYVKLDDNHRPMQVWRHRLGTPQADDVLVYEEEDSGWFTPYPRKHQRAFLRDRRRRPRNLGAEADRSWRSRCATAPCRGARGGRAIFDRRPRR